MTRSHFSQFSSTLRSLTESDFQNPISLKTKLLIAQDGPVEVCYAPFEYINLKARIVIVGITPGYTQMVNALRECCRQLDAGASEMQALRSAKNTGAFSGAMRPNLVALLDKIGLHRWLNISGCDALFGDAADLVQTTSVLRNPVFVNGENYNGTPNMVRQSLLRRQLTDGFGEDAKSLPNAIFVPLGDKVAEALHFLADNGYLAKERILDGLPHPSGANAERIAYFLGRKSRGELSSKTNPDKLDHAREAMFGKIAALT